MFSSRACRTIRSIEDSPTPPFTLPHSTLLLTGWPKVQGQGQELIAAEQGTKVTLFPKTGKMITEGRAQTRIARQLMAEGMPPKATPVQ